LAYIKSYLKIYYSLEKSKYDLPDKSKALRCLMDYVEEKEENWDDMFATICCNRCG